MFWTGWQRRDWSSWSCWFRWSSCKYSNDNLKSCTSSSFSLYFCLTVKSQMLLYATLTQSDHQTTGIAVFNIIAVHKWNPQIKKSLTETLQLYNVKILCSQSPSKARVTRLDPAEFRSNPIQTHVKLLIKVSLGILETSRQQLWGKLELNSPGQRSKASSLSSVVKLIQELELWEWLPIELFLNHHCELILWHI